MCSREIQDTTQPQLTHRAAIYTKEERANTLTMMIPLLPWNGQLFNQKLYIIGNKLGQIRQEGQGQGEHTHNFPRRLNSASQETETSPFQLQQRSRGQRRRYRAYYQKLDDSPRDRIWEKTRNGFWNKFACIFLFLFLLFILFLFFVCEGFFSFLLLYSILIFLFSLHSYSK